MKSKLTEAVEDNEREMILKNSKIDDLGKLCEKLNGDLLIANAEKERLTAELQNLIAEYTKRSEKAEEEATEKLNATEDILQNLVKKIELLSKNKETVDLKLVSQKTENEKLKAELQDAHLKIQQSQPATGDLSGDLMELSEEVDRLQAEIGTSKSLLRQKDIMIKDLKISLEEQIRSSNRLEAENEKLTSELSERDLDLKIQEEELQKTTMKIEELGRQNSEQLKNSKIGNMQNLQNRIKELEQELSYQTERSKELEIKNTDLSKFRISTKNLEVPSDVGDRIIILMTFLRSPSFQCCHQHILSPISVAGIDIAYGNYDSEALGSKDFLKFALDTTVEKLMTDETGLVTKVITEETTETITTTRACPSRKYERTVLLYAI